MARVPLTSLLGDEYQRLFDTCRVRGERANEVSALVRRVAQNRDRYDAVSRPLGIPWYFVGVIHAMEASSNFTCHLHNGDPLTARTVHEPPDRPASGAPPFAWEDSASDALQQKKLDQIGTWTLPRILYQLEGYNGFGYRLRHPEVFTPYLWSFSEHYTSGKYVSDGTFSATATSKQCGAAVLLRRMAELGIIQFDGDGAPIAEVHRSRDSTRVRGDRGPVIRFSTTKRSAVVEALQTMLNTVPGVFVKVDGVPGQKTSDALRKVTGHFLSGDPRARD